jgi:hypothetical protein
MRDPVTFERRLADALEQYNLGAPVDIDSAALASELAARPRRRPFARFQWPSPAVRLLLVAGLLALAVVAGIVGSGMFPSDRPLGQTPGRLMVWIPTLSGSGTTYMYTSAGELQWTRQIASRGCPRLLGDGLMAMGSFGTIRVDTDLGVGVQELDVSYAGGERWAPDGRGVALVDMEDGPITVVRLGVDSTAYDISDAIEAVISNGGERVVVAVPRDGGADLHLLDGEDRVVYEHRPLLDSGLQMAIAPDGSRLAVVSSGASGEPLVAVVSLPDGGVVTTTPSVEPGSALAPISWSPDGSMFALGVDTGVQLYDVAQNAWRDAGMSVTPSIETTRWRADSGGGLGLAMLSGREVAIYREGAAPGYLRLASDATAFEPDGSRIAAIEVDLAQPRMYAEARIRSSDIWGNEGVEVIATLPEDHPRISSDLQPCMQWMP